MKAGTAADSEHYRRRFLLQSSRYPSSGPGDWNRKQAPGIGAVSHLPGEVVAPAVASPSLGDAAAVGLSRTELAQGEVPAIGVGVGESLVVPLPNSPSPWDPQQYPFPPSVARRNGIRPQSRS